HKKMTTPSKHDARLIPVKMEVCQMKEEIPHAELVSSSAAAEAEVDELCCLSGDKPFFSVILTPSHAISPCRLYIPASVAPIFPRVPVPMILTHGGKKWLMSYKGNTRRSPRFEYSDWRTFVSDNNLKTKDACIFEVMESSSTILRLRVLILRNIDKCPPELDAEIESRGNTPETAIDID
ncbi:hypothetical protein C2S53_015871, partial [Perilla frutescens var. hirtella]